MYLNRFFHFQTKTISSSAVILAISALTSRFLGLVRDWLLAKNFGAGPELDVYFAVFRIPDLIYNILIAGGIVIAFLPLFSEYFSKDKEKAWDFTNNILNIFLFLFIIIAFVFLIFTPFLMKLIAPGFDQEQFSRAVFLTRLMFLSPIFFGLSSVFSGILQYFNRFFIYGLCPILYNLGIIFGILFLAPIFSILGVVIGVILGAALHFLIQVPSAISCGFKYRPIFNLKDPGVKKIFLLMIPRIFGIGANQINLMVITAIASTISAGSIAIFNLANNLQYLPVGIIGLSFSMAVFPALSRNWADLKKEEFIKNFSSVFRHILYFIVPVSFLMFLLRNQIVSIILEHGQFTITSARLTAAALGLFSFSIFALSLIPLIQRVFFSFQNTKTPALVTVLGAVLNIALSFYFVWLLKFENPLQDFVKRFLSLSETNNIPFLGLPLAFSISIIFQFVVLMIFLQRKINNIKQKEILVSLLKITSSSILMAAIVYFGLNLFSFPGFWGQVFEVVVIGGGGMIIYFLFTYLFRSSEFKRLNLFISNLISFK